MLSQRLRQRVTIQQKVEEFTTYGEGIGYHWSDFMVDVPAEVLTGPGRQFAGNGREFVAANAKQSETAGRINMRWFPGLLATMRILWDGRTFDIISIETDATGRKEWRLQCADGVNDGT